MPLAPELVHRRLRAASQNLRWTRAGRYLIAGAAASLFFLILFLLCDTRFHVGAFVRWIGFLSVVAPLVAGVVFAVPAWRRPLSELAIARRIETAAPGARNALVNAVQFDRELRPGSSLRAEVFNELADPFPSVDWREVFDVRLLTRLGVALGVVGLIVFAWAMARPAAFTNSVSRVLLPAGRIAPLTRTRLETLEPGNASVMHGSAMDVTASFGGEVPRTAWVHFREAGGSWRRELMSREVGTPSFAFHWKEVLQPMEYYLEAGDLETPVYTMAVRARTAVAARRAEVRPPAYTHLPARTVSNFGTLDGIVPGSQVTLTFDFNNPVKSLIATDEKVQTLPAQPLGDRSWNVALPVTANRTLTVAFHDEEEATGRDVVAVVVKPDEPPKLTLTEPAEGRELAASPTAAFAVQFTATDDYGLGSVGLYRSTNEKPDAELVQEWKEAAGQKTFAAGAQIPLGQYVKPEDKQITFCLVAKDQNDVSGPGVTFSRPLTIALRAPEKVQQQATEASTKLTQNLRELLRLQQTNLAATQTALDAPVTATPVLSELLDRQIKVGDTAAALSASAEEIAPEVRATLRALIQQEMPAAVLSLRNAATAPTASRAALLGVAAKLETLILARLQSAPDKATEEARRAAVQNLIAGVDGLLREQKAILKDTAGATPAGADKLSERQDKLAEQSNRVRKDVETSAGNQSVGDVTLREGLKKIAGMFAEFKIYEGMLTAADTLQSKAFPKATEQETTLVSQLEKMVGVLSTWQLAQAGAQSDAMRKTAEGMETKLAALAELQRQVLEKSKELSRKDQFSKEDENTAAEIARTKDLMGKVVEGMLTDASIFPDMIISNELKAVLSSIYEDVKQDDLDDIAKKKLKPSDIAVQKEDWIMKSIEEAKKIPPDMEMFLPKTSNTFNWLLENFDKTEIPPMDNLPLPDTLTDMIGALQKEQENLADQVQGAASNQNFKAMQQGGPILDGPQSGYSAQGKSGNQKPMDFEQGGRSAGGREGESNGEMVGKMADDLEGRQTHVRRTSDAMQSGNVEDPTHKAADARATGGGKASGFSQREGMDGDAPVRKSTAPRQGTDSALAAAQAQLAEKTSQKAAQVSLLYLRSDKLQAVAGLMQESQTALNEGRLADFRELHKKIMAQLRSAQGELATGRVLSLATGEAGRREDKQAVGAGEGEAPAPYKDRVADYYRSLANGQ